MSGEKIISGKGKWVVASHIGDINENAEWILGILEKGQADTAKITQGIDQESKKITYIIIKNYNM